MSCLQSSSQFYYRISSWSDSTWNVIHSWNNLNWICVINTTCKHIWSYCITLHHRHFYFSPHFILFFLLFTSWWIMFSGTPCTCSLETPRNSLFSAYAALYNLTLLYKIFMYTWFHYDLINFKIKMTLSLVTQR